MHEREVWELFGISFQGNTMLKPLLLEGWRGPYPFRKDFDWRKYAQEFLR
jgi:NADH:ubiquinone oxidoreductase subunit C